MKIIRAVGIDLGTTNSAVGVMTPRGDDIALLADRFDRKTMPSMVGWDPQAEAFVTGWEAWNRRAMEPTPVASIKRKMGTQQTVDVGPHALLPEEISARILGRLTEETEQFLTRRQEREAERPVERAVVTVPAYFDAQQIEATRRAGELAGLEVVGLLQEPTAAAMYHAWKRGIGDGNFLVYDLGGGTFDVSIIRCLMGEYQVLGLDGDNYLGGDDFDRRLAEHLREHLVERGYALELDVAGDDDDRTRFELLRRVAQEVKEGLSQSQVQYVGRRDLFEDQQGQPVSLDIEVARASFEALIADLVEETIACCERALLKSAEAADVTLAEIDHVLLVGGSTRVPLVARRVAEAFCGEGNSRAKAPRSDEPDTCVALGAAIHAANVAGLELVDDEQGARVVLTSGLTSQGPMARLAGRIERADEGLEHVSSVVLIDAVGEIAAIARPEPTGQGEALSFVIDEIALREPGRHEFSLEFCDAEGDPLVSVGVELGRLGAEETLRSTGSALSNPSVLAKDIYLEVVRDGRAARQILLSSGASLPAEETYRFYTTDQSGAVILRLFQSRMPIRTIHLAVPEATEVGTPVDLNLSIDEAMTVVASGEIQGQTFWAQIEPPPARQQRAWSEIEALLDRVELVQRELWGYEARHFRERADRLVAGIRETARTDPDKLQVLVARLEELLEDYHERDAELTPGWGRFEAILDAIKRTVWRGDAEPKLGMDAEQWRDRLGELTERARTAYADHDQDAWSKAFNQAQATWESLAQDEYRFVRSDPEEYVRRMYGALQERAQELREQLDGYNLAENPETRQLQEQRLRELKTELGSKLEGPLRQLDPDRLKPAQARQEIDRLQETISYFERQLDKLPTLGLVRK